MNINAHIESTKVFVSDEEEIFASFENRVG